MSQIPAGGIKSGTVQFGCQVTPSYDKFETITFTAAVIDREGLGSAHIEARYSVEDAEAYVADITRECEKLRADRDGR